MVSVTKIEFTESDQNIEKLVALFTELPRELCCSFISDKLVHSIIQTGKDGTSLIDFGSSFNINFDWSIENFWTPLRPAFRAHVTYHILPSLLETLKSNNLIQYVESLWFFERLQKFIGDKEINYSNQKVFCDILLTGLHLVNVNRFEQESGARGVFQSICLQIRDPNREIDLNQIDWISSCSLPNSCLPGALFRMTNQKSSRGIIFESCMETQFPITALLIAIGSGLDLLLDDFVFDDYLSFGNALSVALAQEPFFTLFQLLSVKPTIGSTLAL